MTAGAIMLVVLVCIASVTTTIAAVWACRLAAADSEHLRAKLAARESSRGFEVEEPTEPMRYLPKVPIAAGSFAEGSLDDDTPTTRDRRLASPPMEMSPADAVDAIRDFYLAEHTLDRGNRDPTARHEFEMWLLQHAALSRVAVLHRAEPLVVLAVAAHRNLSTDEVRSSVRDSYARWCHRHFRVHMHWDGDP